MSVHISARIWDIHFDDPTTKLVALAIADAANRDGGAWPSIPTLASMCGCSDRTIQRHITALEEAGIIEKANRFSGGRQTSNMYQFKEASEGCHGCHPTGDARVTGGVTPVSPSNIEPKEEPSRAEVFPKELNTDAFKTAWDRWRKYMQGIRKGIGDVQRDEIFRTCIQTGADQAAAIILENLKAGNRRLYFDVKISSPPPSAAKRVRVTETTEDRLIREARERGDI